MESPPALSATPGSTHAAIEVNPRARFEILFAVLLGMFLSALDQTIVGPVLPRIVTDLQGADYYTWVVTAYLLTSTVTIPVYGKLSDLYGRRPLLMVGIVLFLIGSVLSGISQTMWQLILFRGIQGLGAGALFPISLAVIGDLFTPAERGKYQGLFGAVFGVAFLVGPFLGGFLTDNISWHWVFFVNLPVGLVSLYFIWHLLPTVKRAGSRFNLDVPGVVTLMLAIVPVLIALTIAENGDWTAPEVVGGFVMGVVFLVVFVLVERRAEDPVIPLGLFRNPTFTVSAIATFFATFGFATAIIFLPLWFQVVQGASSTASGYDLFPFLIGLIASSVVSGQFVSRTGHYKWLLVGSMALVAVGLTLFTNLRTETSTLNLWLWMIVTGIGVGPMMAVFTLIVQNAVPFRLLGTATSDLTLFRQIGTSVGLTVAFTVFQNNLTWGLLRDQIIVKGAPAAAVPAVAPAGFNIGQDLTSVGGGSSTQFLTQVPAQFQQIFLNGFHEAFSIALGNSMWIGVGAAIIACVSALFLHELPLRTTHATTEVPAAADQAKEGPRVPVGADGLDRA